MGCQAVTTRRRGRSLLLFVAATNAHQSDLLFAQLDLKLIAGL